MTNLTIRTTTPPPISLIEKVEHVIHYISIGVLSIFMLEICLKLFAFGPVKFIKHKLEVMDAVVVTVAFFLDIFMSKEAVDDAVSLLVLVRLWRVLHMVTGIVNDVKIAAQKKEVKLRAEILRLKEELEKWKRYEIDPDSNGHL